MVVHKAAEVISLGGTLARNHYSVKQSLIFFGVLQAAFTCGMAIGIFISKSNKVLDSVFFSLSAGMLTYIACSEIIVHEF